MVERFSQRRIGETLTAEVEAGQLVALHLARDADPLPLGSVHEAIVRERIGARLKVDILGEQAWLIAAPNPSWGTRLQVRVVRAPIPEPGKVKPAHVVEHRGLAPAVLEAALLDPFPDDWQVEEWCDCAVSGVVPIPGGALSLERTRAGLVIDVDGHGPDLNLRAAEGVARLLRLFQVGGNVMVDFVSTDSRHLRQEVDATLDEALRKDPRPFERTAMNGFGLVQIIRPRTGASLIDQLCGTQRNRLSLETQMHALLWDAARSKGIGKRTLTARGSIIDAISARPELVEELRDRIAAPVDLARDEKAPGHGHVHVSLR